MSFERGGHPGFSEPKEVKKETPREKEKKNLRQLFLNKWTVMLGLMTGLLASGYKMSEKAASVEETKHEYRLTDKDVSDSLEQKKDLLEGIKALVYLADVLKDAKENGDQRENPTEAKFVQSGRYLVESVEDEEGRISYVYRDQTLPKIETATPENYQRLNDYFSKELPGFELDKVDSWHYNISTGKLTDPDSIPFSVKVMAEEGGGYTIVSVSGLDAEVGVGNDQDLKKVIKDKTKIAELYYKLAMADSDEVDKLGERFIEYLKETGYFGGE